MAEVTLDGVLAVTTEGITTADGNLNTTLDALKNNTSIGAADMINLQFQMSTYTITVQAFSAIMKDISDLLKSIIQKVG